jgi:hypothetical protein
LAKVGEMVKEISWKKQSRRGYTGIGCFLVDPIFAERASGVSSEHERRERD